MAGRKRSRLRADAVPIAIVIAAGLLRGWYAVALFSQSFAPFYGTSRGPDMRIAAILNLGVIVVLVASARLRRFGLVWAACLVALLLHGLPGARVGEVPSLVLPWATAATALVMADAASRTSRGLVAATAIVLTAFAAWLALTLAWAALDYAIAAAAVVLAWSLAGLIRGRLSGHGALPCRR